MRSPSAPRNLAGSLEMLGLAGGSITARELERSLGEGTELPTLAARVVALAAIVAAGPVATTDTALEQPAGPAPAPSLLVVSGNAHFAEGLAPEAAARGRLAQETPAAVVVDLQGIADAPDALNLIGEIDCRHDRMPVIVSGAGEGLRDRVEVARLGVCGSFPVATEQNG